MSKQEIIDYVMTTPGNTNPAILRQMIQDTGPQMAYFKEGLILPRIETTNEEVFFKKPIKLYNNQIYLVRQIFSEDIYHYFYILCNKDSEGVLSLYIDQETEHFTIFEDRIVGNIGYIFEVYGPTIANEIAYEDFNPIFDFRDSRFPIVNSDTSSTLEWDLDELLEEEEKLYIYSLATSKNQVRILIKHKTGTTKTESVVCNIHWVRYFGDYVNVYIEGYLGDTKVTLEATSNNGTKISFIE